MNRIDGLYNLLSSLGTEGDKAQFTSVAACIEHPQEILEALYEGEAYAARIVDSLPRDCVKRGVHVLVRPDGNDDTPTEPFRDWIAQSGVLSKLSQAACWARAYGGGAVVLGVTDTSTSNGRRLQPGGKLRQILPVSRYELIPETYTEVLADPNYGLPSTYRLKTNRGGKQRDQIIHYTRVIRFEGFPLSPQRTNDKQSWGGSELDRCWEKLRNLSVVEMALAHATHDQSVGVLGVDGLSNWMLTSDGESRFKQRMLLWNMAKSVVNMAIIDRSEESFEWLSRDIQGLADCHTVFRMALCGAAGIPHTRFFGDSPAGMSTDDHSGKSLWADQVARGQLEVFTGPLRRIIDIVMSDPDGPTGGREVDYQVVWPEYLQPSDLDKAETEKRQAMADQIWIDKRVLTPEQVFRRRLAGAEGVGEVWEAKEVYEEDRELKAKIVEAEGKGAPQPGEPKKAPGETEERGPAGETVGKTNTEEEQDEA